jgi:hypothetical protein
MDRQLLVSRTRPCLGGVEKEQQQQQHRSIAKSQAGWQARQTKQQSLAVVKSPRLRTRHQVLLCSSPAAAAARTYARMAMHTLHAAGGQPRTLHPAASTRHGCCAAHLASAQQHAPGSQQATAEQQHDAAHCQHKSGGIMSWRGCCFCRGCTT